MSHFGTYHWPYSGQETINKKNGEKEKGLECGDEICNEYNSSGMLRPDSTPHTRIPFNVDRDELLTATTRVVTVIQNRVPVYNTRCKNTRQDL